DAANGTLVWDHTMAQSVNSSPAPTLGRLYVSADMLYCFVPDEAAGVGGGEVAQASLHLEVGPNPIRTSALVEYSIPVETKVSLAVYDVRGRLVRELASGARSPGTYKVQWGGKNDDGEEAAAGIYFVRLDAAGSHISRKAVLVK
ncbi:MAG TPA: FlgD immunoglobulin-like domain containing protein, partial [bacterium]|nr:FlgD immunoglobulin-like domain containing protein [bacterium]